MRRSLFTLALVLLSLVGKAQELQCGVTINTPNLALVDPKVFNTLETAVFEFMNNRVWTGDKFKQDERIRCEINITITEELAVDRFRAQVAIQAIRPVYNSDYETLLFNWLDKDWEFSYVEYQNLEFNVNSNIANLTSMLAYYAYVILAFDYDSQAPNGGTQWWQTAQQIVNNSQNAVEKGWKPFDGIRNRYWLVDNLLNPRFADFRNAYFRYHREGLDMFYENQLTPVTVVTECLQSLNGINTSNPNSMAIQVFFNAKSDEIIGIYADAAAQEKTKAIALLNRMDAQRASDYRRIMGGR